MASVTYNANGATGGSVPTDPNNYAIGANVTVLGNTGGLTKAGETFAYWNTAQNGSGSVLGGGATFTIGGNTTLYAQWFTTAGLTVTAPHTTPGVTDQYAIAYDASLSAADGVNRANALISHCDADFAQMNALFGNIGTPFTAPIQVNLSAGGYAGAGWGPPIGVTPGNGSSGDLVRYLLVSEVVEMFMRQQGAGWGYSYGDSNEGSKGEALSRFLGYYFLSTNGLNTAVLTQGGSTFFVSNQWLNSPRPDNVNYTPDDNKPDVTTGCTTLFLYYLYSQLNFSIPAIIGAGSDTMAGVYRNLTGDTIDPFPFFARLVNGAFPGTNQITSGPNFDDPFPIGLLSFWMDSNTLSRDQVADIVAHQSGVVWNAFYLVLEGFSIDSYNHYNVQVPTPAFSPAVSGASVRPSPIGPGQPVPAAAIPIFEQTTNPKAPQRIRFSFDLVFTDESAFPQHATDSPNTALLTAKAQVGGSDLPGAQCRAGFEFLGGANPYFTNVDPTNPADLAYLSQDLRVFKVVAGEAPLLGAPAFTTDPYASIQSFLQWINGNSQFTTPTGPNLSDPLNDLPGQHGYETADSSVSPTNETGTKTYNFALARVRLRGLGGDSADACRVFFRLFVAQSCDTDFQPNTTYKSVKGTTGADNGHPIFPQASATGITDPSGQALQTIPFFATDINGTHDYDGSNANANIRNVTIPLTGDEIWAYYGCFLDIYDAAGNANNLAGTHHCIAAEIAYSGAPIPATTASGAAPNPLSWDQLAQRNLQITLSENPKSRATHIVGQAFDIRPSRPLAPLPGTLLDLPDELMIDWGNMPVGSEAAIYWPGLDAHKVLALADRSYASHQLYAIDGHTIGCRTTRGVTYLPIPHLSGVNFAGLLTIDLPNSIHHGQIFEAHIRRVASRRGAIAPPPPPRPPGPEIAVARVVELAGNEPRKQKPAGRTPAPVAFATKEDSFSWRQIVGAFTVRVPVTHRKAMLPIEENTLAILRWRYQQAAPQYRWRPVWERLIRLTELRVTGLGGDPAKISPALGGYRGAAHSPHSPWQDGEPGCDRGFTQRERDDDVEFTGKIDGMVYDRFGDFAGFRLRDEEGEEHRFRAHEAAIERLAGEAWRDRWVVTVIADAGAMEKHEHEHKHSRDLHGDRDRGREPDAWHAPWAEALILRRR
jgi:hypothetical protein